MSVPQQNLLGTNQFVLHDGENDGRVADPIGLICSNEPASPLRAYLDRRIRFFGVPLSLASDFLVRCGSPVYAARRSPTVARRCQPAGPTRMRPPLAGDVIGDPSRPPPTPGSTPFPLSPRPAVRGGQSARDVRQKSIGSSG